MSTKTKQSKQSFLTLPAIAVRLRVREFHVRELIRRGIVTPSRAGHAFFFPESQLPEVRKALIDAGYLASAEG